jgi:hypothetical protein
MQWAAAGWMLDRVEKRNLWKDEEVRLVFAFSLALLFQIHNILTTRNA